MPLSEEDGKKIAQILREEQPGQSQKPSFPHGKHLYRSILSGGLWLPVWLALSLWHDRKWHRRQK